MYCFLVMTFSCLLFILYLFHIFYFSCFQAVNDESPVVLGEQVVVEKGQTVVLQNESLSISDADSGAENLIISVEQVPQHGENLTLCLGIYWWRWHVSFILSYNDVFLYQCSILQIVSIIMVVIVYRFITQEEVPVRLHQAEWTSCAGTVLHFFRHTEWPNTLQSWWF